MKETDDTRQRLEAGLQEAEEKAWKALAGYKFTMFGYWAAIWVHLNRPSRFGHANPFRDAVALARTHTEAAEPNREEAKDPAKPGTMELFGTLKNTTEAEGPPDSRMEDDRA